MKLDWLLFRIEGTGVHYFWNGEHPTVVHVGAEDGHPADWYWLSTELEMPNSESQLLTELASKGSRKKVFTVSRTHRRYVVVARGTFGEE